MVVVVPELVDIDRVESSSSCHLFDCGSRSWVLQADLGSCQNERLSEVSVHLPSEQVEVVRWGGTLSNLEVDVLGCQGLVCMHISGIICVGVDVLEEPLHVAS